MENTEIGCHIKIDSSPNIYETDAQAMIQFLKSELRKFSFIVFLISTALRHWYFYNSSDDRALHSSKPVAK